MANGPPLNRQRRWPMLLIGAASYGIPGAIVDGMDVAAVHEAAIEAIARARSGAGPTLLECKTYRYYDHVGRDFGILRRDPEEIAWWRARDPIKLWRETLIAQGRVRRHHGRR